MIKCSMRRRLLFSSSHGNMRLRCSSEKMLTYCFSSITAIHATKHWVKTAISFLQLLWMRLTSITQQTHHGHHIGPISSLVYFLSRLLGEELSLNTVGKLFVCYVRSMEHNSMVLCRRKLGMSQIAGSYIPTRQNDGWENNLDYVVCDTCQTQWVQVQFQ